jgi:exodeoxyribonuclease VII large subunit
LKDFLNVLKKNSFEYTFNVRLFSVMLQGNKAAESIAKQLKVIESQKAQFDIVVLVRGGGGNVDLHCFNSYILAEAIALSSLPVITGIGHTTDYTVADEVAAVHKETPTAVAQYIISQCSAFEESVNASAERLIRQTVRLLDYEDMYLEKAADEIQYKPRTILGNEKMFLSRVSGILSAQSMGTIKVAHSETDAIYKTILNALKRIFSIENDKLKSVDQVVKAHDPMQLLKKGYSITRFSGATIKSLKNIHNEDEIETITAEGRIISTVKSTKISHGKDEL